MLSTKLQSPTIKAGLLALMIVLAISILGIGIVLSVPESDNVSYADSFDDITDVQSMSKSTSINLTGKNCIFIDVPDTYAFDQPTFSFKKRIGSFTTVDNNGSNLVIGIYCSVQSTALYYSVTSYSGTSDTNSTTNSYPFNLFYRSATNSGYRNILILPNGITKFSAYTAYSFDASLYSYIKVGFIGSSGGSDDDSSDFGNYEDFYNDGEEPDDLFTGITFDYPALEDIATITYPLRYNIPYFLTLYNPDTYSTIRVSWEYQDKAFKLYDLHQNNELICQFDLINDIQIYSLQFSGGYYIKEFRPEFIDNELYKFFFFFNENTVSTDVYTEYYNTGYTDGYNEGYQEGVQDIDVGTFLSNYDYVSIDGGFRSLLTDYYINTTVEPYLFFQDTNQSTGVSYTNLFSFEVAGWDGVVANYPVGINMQKKVLSQSNTRDWDPEYSEHNNNVSNIYKYWIYTVTQNVVQGVCLGDEFLYSESYEFSYQVKHLDNGTNFNPYLPFNERINETETLVSSGWTSKVQELFDEVQTGIYKRNTGVNTNDEQLYLINSNPDIMTSRFSREGSWGYWLANIDKSDFDYIYTLGYIQRSSEMAEALQEEYQKGYDKSYEDWYQTAYNRGYLSANTTEPTFTNMITAMIDAPINAIFGTYDSTEKQRVGGLFNFELLGVNLAGFFMSLLSVALVLFIIKLVLAK